MPNKQFLLPVASTSGSGGGGGAVSSVFGRTGSVVAHANDYAAVPNLVLGDGNSEITCTTASGEIVVQDQSGSNLTLDGATNATLTGGGLITVSGAEVFISVPETPVGGITIGTLANTVKIGNGTFNDASGTLLAATVNATTGYKANGTAGVSAGSFSSITAITSTEGIVTQLTGTSDERLKESVDYNGGLEKILNLKPASYRWNSKGQIYTGLSGDRTYVGFIAQDVQRVIPEAITGTEGEEQYLSFDDRPIVAALVNAVKTLTARVSKLELK